MSMEASSWGGLAVTGEAESRKRGALWIASSRLFHVPHWGHRPSQRGLSAPQSRQTKVVLVCSFATAFLSLRWIKA